MMRSSLVRLAVLGLLIFGAAAIVRSRDDDRLHDRLMMVEMQIRARDITDSRVLDAMRRVPRHMYVPAAQRAYAYADHPLPIGSGQTISQPYIVALMTELLGLARGERVLEIGTGSGYQAAILKELTPHVYTIEIVRPLYDNARIQLAAIGLDSDHVRFGDGYYGLPQHAPFDAIIVTAAVDHVPPPLLRQLDPGGRMVIPIGPPYLTQQLVLVEKDASGKIRTRSLLPVRFVPLTRNGSR